MLPCMFNFICYKDIDYIQNDFWEHLNSYFWNNDKIKTKQQRIILFLHFHPFKPFLHSDTTRIIVGTLPPPRFCTGDFKVKDVNFCYGSCDGLLWPCLEKIYHQTWLYDNSLEAVLQRKEFLIKNKIGICDIVDSCSREKIDASDLGMSDIKTRDILGYLKEYKNIHTLIFTGGNSKNGPEYFFRKLLKQTKITYDCISNQTPKVHQFSFDNRTIKTISLTAPSNAANRAIGATTLYKENKKANPNYSTFEFRVEQYTKVFL